MADITLIGLGAMGSAIATALLNNNCDLLVWNRSADKVKPLLDQGVQTADSLATAVAASPRIMICIDGYDNTKALFDAAELTALLHGKTIIQMSTGTPAQAREAESWVHQSGAKYLDCAIMVYPETVGSSSAQLLISGAKDTPMRIVHPMWDVSPGTFAISAKKPVQPPHSISRCWRDLLQLPSV